MAKTILLADDSVTIQKVVDLTFMDEDYEVVAVSDGSEAMRRFPSVAPVLVIADVHMPGLNGYEVCRQVKQASPGTPVLLLVGTFELFDEARAAEAGADGSLKKPFDSQDLLNRVESLVRNRPAAVSAAPAESRSPFDDVSSRFEIEETYPEPIALPADDPFPSLAPVAGDDVFELEPDPPSPAPPSPSAEAEKPVAFNFGGFEPAPVASELFEPLIEPAPEPAAPMVEEPEVWPHELAAEPEPAISTPPMAEAPTLPPMATAGPAPTAAAAPAPPSNGQPTLSDADVDRIARRVADLVAEKIVREVAWEVVPDLAEIAIRERIQELESEIE